MRALLAAATWSLVPLLGCTDRQVPVDYTEEVVRICTDLCEKVVTCVEPPLFSTEAECRASCTRPEHTMYEDSACGEAFRELYSCIGGTENCEEYLDTNNVYAEDYTCKEEKEVLATLKCGAPGEGD
jgi:hypothetical protein